MFVACNLLFNLELINHDDIWENLEEHKRYIVGI